MKARTTFTAKRLLIAAAVALAPAGATLAADACAGDPFAPYNKSFRSDGPEYECTAAAPQQAGAQGAAGPVLGTAGAAGAQGPAGPMLESASLTADDPFADYRRAFTAD